MKSEKNHEISLASAIEMTQRFRTNRPAGFANSEAFSKEAIHKLLNVVGCAALRIYYGKSQDMEAHAILVAADADGNDILPLPSSNVPEHSGDEDPVIIEDSWRCPPLCPEDSPLNGD